MTSRFLLPLTAATLIEKPAPKEAVKDIPFTLTGGAAFFQRRTQPSSVREHLSAASRIKVAGVPSVAVKTRQAYSTFRRHEA